MPHIHEAIDFTVAAFIVNENKVLLIHHKQLDKWLPIGGHIELDEDPEEGLFREIKEETGINLGDLIVLSDKPKIKSKETKFLFTPNYLDLHDISETHKHVGITYFIKSKTNELKLAELEHNEIKWFTPEEFENPEYELTNAIKFYCKQALKKALDYNRTKT